MSIECAECERDLRGGHDPSCSRYVRGGGDPDEDEDPGTATTRDPCSECSAAPGTGHHQNCSLHEQVAGRDEEPVDLGKEIPILCAKFLVQALARRYPRDDGWCLVPEFAVGSRRVDALAVCVYPSRGFLRLAFEVKVDRRDWLKELKTPEKADAVFKFVHEFWVAAPSGIVVPEELPPGWGLLEARVCGSKIVFKTAVRARRQEPEEPKIEALCQVVRRVWDHDREQIRALVGAQIRTEHSLEMKRKTDRFERDLARLKADYGREHRTRLQVLDELEAGLGHRLTEFWSCSPRKAGELLKLVLGADPNQVLDLGRRTRSLAEILDQLAAELGTVLKHGT